MHKIALAVLTISLTLSCASCNERFNWDAKPSVGDSKHSQVIDKNGVTVKCDQPKFDDFICFPSENIASLKAEIDRINKKYGNKKMQSDIDRVFREIKKARSKPGLVR